MLIASLCLAIQLSIFKSQVNTFWPHQWNVSRTIKKWNDVKKHCIFLCIGKHENFPLSLWVHATEAYKFYVKHLDVYVRGAHFINLNATEITINFRKLSVSSHARPRIRWFIYYIGNNVCYKKSGDSHTERGKMNVDQ